MTGLITLATSLTALAASVVTLIVVRGRRRGHARLSRVLADTIARLAAVTAELNDGLDRLGRETRLTIALGELAAAADLEDALTRTAETAAMVSGARAAVARAVAADGRVVVGATQPAPDIAFATEIEWPSTGTRGMTFTFLRDRVAGREEAVGAGLALPIGDPSGSPVALVSVLFAEPEDAHHAIADLESLAARAAPIIAGLLDMRVADRPGSLDELTGLATRQAFHQALARETARARRHGAPLAVAVLDVDDLRGVNERLGRESADAALAALGRCVETILPPGAAASRVAGDEFAVVLPASTRRDAELFLTRFDAERESLERCRNVTVTAGTAELMPADDAITLFERAANALQAAKKRRGRDPKSGAHDAHGQV